MTLKEKTYEKIGNIVSPFFTIAGANLQDSLNDFKAAKKNEHAEIKNSVDELKNKNLENFIINNLKIPTNTRGVVYNANSKESEQLSETIEIMEFIATKRQEMLRKNQKKVYDIDFNWRNLSLDEHLGVQHCKLYNPHITFDGYFEATIIDYWDFAYRTDSNNATDMLLNDINNWGYSMQEKSRMENQFKIYQIRKKLW